MDGVAGVSWSNAENEFSPICKLSNYMKQDSQLVYSGKNLSVPSLHFKWVNEPSTVGENHEDLSQGQVDKNTNTVQSIGGFTMKWHVKGSDMPKDNAGQQSSKDEVGSRKMTKAMTFY